MLLRPRQKAFVAKTIVALREHGNTLAVAPTGAGKTIMLSAVLGRMFNKDIKRACVLAHRDELTSQNEGKFKRMNPALTTSIFNASEKSWDGQVAFAMVQTLARNLAQMPPLDALVIDEAHHAMADSYMRVIEHAQKLNPDLKLLGMTATPNRGDKKGLRPIFSNVADQITVKELIASGHLAPPRTFVMDVGVQKELSKVRKNKLDYDMGAVADIMNTRPINDAVAHHWKEKAGDRQTVVFCSTVGHAESVVNSFVSAGIATAMVWGKMSDPDREKTLADYGRGDIQVIVNVAILTEGWDHPPTSCVILLRPSSYKSTMVQMIGRGLRTIDPGEHPGIIKKDCVVLDFGTSTVMHGSLEEEAQLTDNRDMAGDVPYKNCPECGADVPLGSRECPLCAYIWEDDKAGTDIHTDDFQMTEINILERSSFYWCDLYGDDQHFIATGFEAWGGVFHRGGEWYAVGARKDHPVKFLASGARIACFAAADDWINLFETESAAHKTKSWLNLPATEKQLSRLPSEYRDDKDITRYRASALMTMRFNKTAILQVINGNAL